MWNKSFKAKFDPLFKVQFLAAINDNLLKSALLVLISYNTAGKILNLSEEQAITFAVGLFILPFFLFSSYAGKIADYYDKIKIVKIIKICEILIMLIASIGFILNLPVIIILSLFLMGVHSTFFGPIKYSILPEYFEKEDVILATGYIEMGTFIAILVGQGLGSWLMSSHGTYIIIALLLLLSAVGCYYSFKMFKVASIGTKPTFYLNIFKDVFFVYQNAVKNRQIRRNLHSISWFWAIGTIYTTQLSILTKIYFGGDGHVFSVIMGLFSISIGVGSLVCARQLRGKIIHSYATFGMVCLSCITIFLLLLNSKEYSFQSSLNEFTSSIHGMFIFIEIFMIGFFAGFYSVTCYSELQLIAPIEIRSQIIAANNILNAFYMVLASVISSIILSFTKVWWLIMIAALINLIFAVYYHRSSKLNSSF